MSRSTLRYDVKTDAKMLYARTIGVPVRGRSLCVGRETGPKLDEVLIGSWVPRACASWLHLHRPQGRIAVLLILTSSWLKIQCSERFTRRRVKGCVTTLDSRQFYGRIVSFSERYLRSVPL